MENFTPTATFDANRIEWMTEGVFVVVAAASAAAPSDDKWIKCWSFHHIFYFRMQAVWNSRMVCTFDERYIYYLLG